MRFTLLLLISVFSLSTQSCKKLKDLTTFTMEYDETVVIGSGTGLGLPLDLFTPEMKTNSEETFKNNDTRVDLVSEIKLDKLLVRIDDPNNANFDFLKSIKVVVKSENEPELTVAELNPVADGLFELNLNTTDENLKSYIAAEKFTIGTEVVTDKVISQDYTLHIYTTFKVRAKLL